MLPSEEIKSKLDIVDVIREYVPSLKQSGANWKALCPFHKEKTPSFMVNQERQIWKCFGCGRGGDIFTFIMEIEGVDFIEALKILANKAGVVLKKQDPKLVSQKSKLFDICELATKFFVYQLENSRSAKSIRDYLDKRGFDEAVRQRWQIGWAPNLWDGLLKFLKSRKFSEKDIFLSGLVVKRERGNLFYDRFRDRIMFPIRNLQGQTVGFTGRVGPSFDYQKEKVGKYINTPQTMIYNKGNILFGLDKSKTEIRKKDLAILVEGQADIISSYEAGVKNVVASSGTALTLKQLELLKRLTNNLALSFDMDNAGQLATQRSIDLALENDMNIKIIQLPSGKDADELIREDKNKWFQSVVNAVDFLQYYYNKFFSNINLDKVEDVKKALQNFLPQIAKSNSRVEQDYWLKKISSKLNLEEIYLRESLEKIIKKNNNQLGESDKINNLEKNTIKQDNIIENLSQEERLNQLLLAFSLKFIENLEDIVSRLPLEILQEKYRKIYKKLIIYYTNYKDKKNFKLKDFINWLSYGQQEQKEVKSDIEDVNSLLFLFDNYYEKQNLDSNIARVEILKIIDNLQKIFLSKKLKKIEEQIAKAEKIDDKENLPKLLVEFKNLSDKIKEIEN